MHYVLTALAKTRKKINCLFPKALDALNYWTAAIIVDNGSLALQRRHNMHMQNYLGSCFLTKHFRRWCMC